MVEVKSIDSETAHSYAEEKGCRPSLARGVVTSPLPHEISRSWEFNCKGGKKKEFLVNI